MKYYSDILNLLFEKEEDLHLAEKQHFDAKKAKEEAKKKKEQEKKTRTVEVEQAFKAAEAAQNKAQTLLDKYLKDYGTFTSTLVSENTDEKNKDISSDLSEFINILTSFLNN